MKSFVHINNKICSKPKKRKDEIKVDYEIRIFQGSFQCCTLTADFADDHGEEQLKNGEVKCVYVCGSE
jgi:hypothetical protein